MDLKKPPALKDLDVGSCVAQVSFSFVPLPYMIQLQSHSVPLVALYSGAQRRDVSLVTPDVSLGNFRACSSSCSR